MKRDLIACLPLVLAATLGAWQAFPIFDDGYYLLLLREGGPQTFVPAHPDRPLYGWLLGGTAAWVGESAAALAFFSSLVWLGLALLTGKLWRETFPQTPEWSPLAAAGVVAPVWAQIQLSTATVVIPDVLPVAIALAGALLLKSGRDVFGLACLGAAAILSEYGLCAALALAPWMYVHAGSRRLISAALVTFAFFAAFLATRQTEGGRQDVTVHYAAKRLQATPAEAPLRLARGLARLAVGAPMGALAFEGPASERPRAAAAAWAFAVLSCLTLVVSCAPRRADAPESWPLLWPVGAGCILALLPVVAFGRDPAETDFGSRFVLPALPLAALLLPAMLSRCLRPWAWRPAAALFGLAFGLAAFQTAFEAVEHTRAVERLAARLAEASSDAGYVVALVDSGRGARWAPGSPYMLTAQAERDLPKRMHGRLWFRNASTAAACPPELDWEGRRIRRRGPVAACYDARLLPNGSWRIAPLRTKGRADLVLP